MHTKSFKFIIEGHIHPPVFFSLLLLLQLPQLLAVTVAAGHTARGVVRAGLRQCREELEVAASVWVHVGRIAGVVHRDAGRRR